MLSEEKINLNYATFLKKLEKYGIYTEKLKEDEEFNSLLKSASAFTNEDSGGAYEGSLIEHINSIGKYAFNINNLLPETIRVNVDSLIKVCLIHQISKSLMLVKNTVDYEIKKGRLFSFRDDIPAIKTGEYSIYLCNKYGIELTTEEFEAILSFDKSDDSQTKFFGNKISKILKSAIDMAIIERTDLYKQSKHK